MRGVRYYVVLGVIYISLGLLYAQEDAYKTMGKELKGHIEELKELLGSVPLSFSHYDKWYKDFKPLEEEFVQRFSSSHKGDVSFGLFKEMMDNFSLAWGLLKQFDYAQTQYREYISSGDASYAHKWREDANKYQKQAKEALRHALEIFVQAEGHLK